MTYKVPTRGVCSRSVSFDLEEGVVRNVRFEGGCSGNTQGVAALVEGMEAEEAVRLAAEAADPFIEPAALVDPFAALETPLTTTVDDLKAEEALAKAGLPGPKTE